MANDLQSIYVLYGEEKYLIDNAVKKIKKNFGTLQDGINYCYIDESNVGNIISEIETPSFGFEKKLIIVKNAGLFTKSVKSKKGGSEIKEKTNTPSSKLAEYIEKNINIIKQSVVLVIIEEKAEKCTLFNVIKKLEENSENNVIVREFQKLKINELVDWLKKICNMYKVQVDNSVLAYLVEVSGTSMQKRKI